MAYILSEGNHLLNSVQGWLAGVLLSIALRVLCLVEFTMRKALQEQSEKLSGIYAGNPKQATAKPTSKMLLRVFQGITLTLINFNGMDCSHISALNAVQTRILALLGFPLLIYQAGLEI